MTEETALVPAGRLAPIARQFARAAITFGSVVGLAVLATVVFAVIGEFYVVGAIISIFFGPIAVSAVRKGLRVAGVARLAETGAGAGYSFALTGRRISVYDETGLYCPELSFGVGRQYRRELVAGPKAIVRVR